MTTPEERILELARKNAIGSDEASRLLSSMKPAVPRAGFDPFVRFSAGLLAGLGLVASIAAAALAPLGVRFPGFLDVLAADRHVGALVVIVDQLGAFPLAAIIFWIAGRLLSKNVRLVDALATVGLARVPQVVLAIPVALVGGESIVGRIFVFFVLVGIGLQVWLLVLGFRTATGAQGGRLAVGVIGSIIAAEVAAKVVVSLVH